MKWVVFLLTHPICMQFFPGHSHSVSTTISPHCGVNLHLQLKKLKLRNFVIYQGYTSIRRGLSTEQPVCRSKGKDVEWFFVCLLLVPIYKGIIAP